MIAERRSWHQEKRFRKEDHRPFFAKQWWNRFKNNSERMGEIVTNTGQNDGDASQTVSEAVVGIEELMVSHANQSDKELYLLIAYSSNPRATTAY